MPFLKPSPGRTSASRTTSHNTKVPLPSISCALDGPSNNATRSSPIWLLAVPRTGRCWRGRPRSRPQAAVVPSWVIASHGAAAPQRRWSLHWFRLLSLTGAEAVKPLGRAALPFRYHERRHLFLLGLGFILTFGGARGQMSTDARWTIGTGIAIATLLATLMVSQHGGLETPSKHGWRTWKPACSASKSTFARRLPLFPRRIVSPSIAK